MIKSFTDLGSGTDPRKLLMTASSQAALGLSFDEVFRLGSKQNPSQRSELVPATPPSLAERVFNALAAAKIWTSHVAMHMDLAARDRYFRQLDLLHDCDEWFGDDQPIQLESYKNFVRFMLSVGGSSKPSLALASSGRLLAVWDHGGDRLTIEFGTDDSAQWVVSRREGSATERAAGTTKTARVLANIAPFNPGGWFRFD